MENNNNILQGSHNSATSGKSYKWYHKLFVPFARCQNKSLKQQWDKGVRFYDLRVTFIDNSWHVAHGLWTGGNTLECILQELIGYSNKSRQTCYVSITLEKGKCDDFLVVINNMIDQLNKSDEGKIEPLEIAIKLPQWTTLYFNDKFKLIQDFIVIKGWKCIIPIPYFWNLFYQPKLKIRPNSIYIHDFI